METKRDRKIVTKRQKKINGKRYRGKRQEKDILRQKDRGKMGRERKIEAARDTD